MSSAVCPCCGYKQPVPDTSLGKRVTCPNCDTPFTAGSAPPPAPEPTPIPEPAFLPAPFPTARNQPRVAVEQPIPVAEAEEDVPTAEVIVDPVPVGRAGRNRRQKSDPNDGSRSDTKIPRARKAHAADAEDDPFAVPEASSPRKKKSGAGCAIALGVVAFLGILVCGGGGLGGYYLWNSIDEPVANGPPTVPVDPPPQPPPPPPIPAQPKPKTVVDLARELSNTDRAVRLEAANALADMETKAAFATPELAKAMRTDPEKDVRRAASRALKSIGNQGERRLRVEAFLNGLGDADETVKKNAEEGLKDVGKLDSREETILQEALEKSPSPVVQKRALDELLTLDLKPDVAIAVFSPLLKNKDKDKELRVKAAEALGRTKVDRARPERDRLYAVLFDALGDKDPRVLEAAMKGLTALGSKPEDLKKLRAKLRDKMEPLPVRVWACQSIGDIVPKPTTVPQELLDALGESTPEPKRAALAALTKLGNVEGAAEALAGALNDTDPLIRRLALVALGNLGKEAATSTIKTKIARMMDDKDPAIRKEAADVLRKIDPEELSRSYSSALLGGTSEQRKEAADALRALGPEAKTRLSDLLLPLRDPKLDADVRFHIALAVVAIDPTSSDPVSALVEALKGDNPDNRHAAVKALAQLGPAANDALYDLATALKDRNLAVREGSAKALARLDAEIRKLPRPQKEALITSLITSMDDPKMHAAAGAALLEIGPDCVDNLIKLVDDRNEAQKHPQTVVGAALVLQKFGKKIAGSAAKPLQNAALRIKDKEASKVVDDASKALK